MRRHIAVASLLLAGALHAQAQSPPAQVPAGIQDGRLRLSLDEAIALALQHNLDVELQRLVPALADTDVRRTEAGALPRGVPTSVREGPRSITPAGADISPVLGFGPETYLSIGSASIFGPLPPAFDAVISGRFTLGRTTTPQNNSFQVGTTSLVADTRGWNVALQQGLKSGGALSFAFENSRQDVNHPRNDLNPFYATTFGVTFTQPLWRGFGTAVNTRFIRIARNSRQQSDLVFRQQVISTTAAVVRLYWDLVSLTEGVAVRRQALERAERLLRDTQAQVEVGTRAPIEAVRARAEVARAERDVIVAEGQRRQQETVLKDYLSLETLSDSVLAAVVLEPTEPFRVDADQPIPTTAVLAEHALSIRPDIAQARLQLESTRLALIGSQHARRPTLDLVASVRSNGLAGDLNPFVLPGASPHTTVPLFIGGYGSALSHLSRLDFPDWAVSLQLGIPIQNRAADADAARDALSLRQQELRLLQMRKQVHLEIENARIALEQAGAVLRAATSERELQEQALAAEQEKLDVGASTIYLVIQYQRDLAQARSAEVAARAAYMKARTALGRASGTLLEDHGIFVDGTTPIPREGDRK